MNTIKNHIENEIVIERSRFICHLKRVDSIEEATDFIEQIKKDHWKASHNCYAMVIGRNARSSDDGEPSGTAGVPILSSLQKNELSNVIAIVTRYFGGIKLGAGGLIRAYSSATSEAIKKATIIESVEVNEVKVTVNYSLANILESKITEICPNIEYTDKVVFTYHIEPGNLNTFEESVTELTNNNYQLEHIKTLRIDRKKDT